MNQHPAADAKLLKLLGGFEPLSGLNSNNLDQLARGASAFSLSKRQRLVAADEHRWFVFLLSGSLQGKTAAGELSTIKPRLNGQSPLFDAQPRLQDITVVEDAEFLRVDRKQFQVLINEQIASSTLVEEIVMSEDEAALFDHMVTAYQAGELLLPLRPGLVEAVSPLLSRRDQAVDAVLTELMGQEPALALIAARVVGETSNKGAGSAASFSQLVSAIDKPELAGALEGWAAHNPFPDKGSQLARRIVSGYDYLRRVGAFAAAIAESIDGVDAEQARFAGVCSCVGVIPLWCHQLGVDGVTSATLDAQASQLCALVSEMLLSQCKVDGEIIGAVEGAASSGGGKGGQITVSDVLRVAMTYLPVDIFGNTISLGDDEALMERFSRVGIGLRELGTILERCQLDAGKTLRRAS